MSLFVLRKLTHHPPKINSLKEKNIISDFEDKRLWSTAPEEDFPLKTSGDHVTEGKHSLEAVFPKGGLPSINTRRFDHNWGEYESFAIDIFNSEKEAISFTIRLDDINKQKTNIPYTLQPGLNKVQIAYSHIASKIDAQHIGFIVLFINEPSKRYKLYFDNMRLERSGLVAGLREEKLKKKQEEENAPPLPVRHAVVLPKKPIETKGEIQIALARLKNVMENKPLISSGIPFAPGQLISKDDFTVVDDKGNEIPIATKVLALWPQDQSIRSVLVQFKYPIEHLYEYATLKWGARRSTTDLSIIEPNWDYPEGWILLPAKWLCDSQVIGEQVPMGLIEFNGYDENILKNYDEVKNKPWTGDVREDGYYSTPHVFYQIYARSGELKYFLDARKEFLHYRDSEIVQEGENSGRSATQTDPRYVYIETMEDDYLLTGDPKSLTVAGYMAEYLRNYMKPDKAFYPKDEKRFFTERLMAFLMLEQLNYYELTQNKESVKLAGEFMENLYKTQLQWPSRGGFIHNLYAHDPEEGARPDEYGGSPFMTGLLLEAIIKYHQLTASDIAADSIFRAVDWLIKEALVSTGDSFRYTTADINRDSAGEPDLNLLIVHGLGYAYRLSGYQNQDYLQISQQVFNRGVKEAYLSKRKHFNQNYRNSGHYLAYIIDGLKQKTIPAELDENKTVSSKPDIFYFEGFDSSMGRFKSQGDANLESSSSQVYLNGNALQIQSKFESAALSAGVDFDGWDINSHSHLSFAYFIPKGTPVGMRVKTQFGDWICIGGTVSYRCAGTPSQKIFVLNDDGQWHEMTDDIGVAVKSVLPSLEKLSAFEFYTQQNAVNGDQFWIDDFKISR